MEKVPYCLNPLCLSNFGNYHPLRRIITSLLVTGGGVGGGVISWRELLPPIKHRGDTDP